MNQEVKRHKEAMSDLGGYLCAKKTTYEKVVEREGETEISVKDATAAWGRQKETQEGTKGITGVYIDQSKPGLVFVKRNGENVFVGTFEMIAGGIQENGGGMLGGTTLCSECSV